MKSNKGISLISFIITILIFILIGFLGYEIFYIDILDIMNENSMAQENEMTNNRVTITGVQNQEYSNTSSVSPIIDEYNFENKENVYSNSYYYNQLDEYGKIIYDGLYNNKENMKSGVYKIDFETKFNDLLNSEGGEEKLNIAFQSAWNAFTYDNVDVFYIDVEKLTLTTKTTSIAGFSTHRVELTNGNNSSYLKNNFASKYRIDEKVNELESIKKSMQENLTGYNDYEKIRSVHDWLIENVEYDTNAEEPYTIAGALTEGKAVCEGYARSFKYLMDGLNVPCVLVSGIGTNSRGETEAHAWNYVMIDGKWYAVDVTWDDPVIVGSGYISDDMNYSNFLKGSNTFFESHKEDGNLTENSIKFKFPELAEEDW